MDIEDDLVMMSTLKRDPNLEDLGKSHESSSINITNDYDQKPNAVGVLDSN